MGWGSTFRRLFGTDCDDDGALRTAGVTTPAFGGGAPESLGVVARGGTEPPRVVFRLLS